MLEGIGWEKRQESVFLLGFCPQKLNESKGHLLGSKAEEGAGLEGI